VAWLDHGSIPLTYEERRVVDDTRFMVVRPYSKEWNLQIRNIQPEDQGQYRCTINTSPVKSKVIMLHVKGSFSFRFLTSIVYSRVEIVVLSVSYTTLNANTDVVIIANSVAVPIQLW